MSRGPYACFKTFYSERPIKRVKPANGEVVLLRWFERSGLTDIVQSYKAVYREDEYGWGFYEMNGRLLLSQFTLDDDPEIEYRILFDKWVSKFNKLHPSDIPTRAEYLKKQATAM
jgi:hypothetical protein